MEQHAISAEQIEYEGNQEALGSAVSEGKDGATAAVSGERLSLGSIELPYFEKFAEPALA